MHTCKVKILNLHQERKAIVESYPNLYLQLAKLQHALVLHNQVLTGTFQDNTTELPHTQAQLAELNHNQEAYTVTIPETKKQQLYRSISLGARYHSIK